MKLTDLIKIGKETVSALYPEREAGEMVFAYLAETLGIQRYTPVVEPEYDVAPEEARAILKDFDRLAAGEPLQYVTGKAYFYGRVFQVNPHVLIPRPETELLCRTALEHIRERGVQSPKILDLCTGSGCIAWTMAGECAADSYGRQNARIEAVDISEEALETAASQSIEESVSVRFHKADVLKMPDPTLFSKGSYDIILSNPPYVMDSEKALMRTNVLDYEPHLALFVSDDDPLVFYRAVARWALKLLKVGGYGLVEINEALGEQTADVFRQAGFAEVAVIKDLYEKDRFVEFIRII